MKRRLTAEDDGGRKFVLKLSMPICETSGIYEEVSGDPRRSFLVWRMEAGALKIEPVSADQVMALATAKLRGRLSKGFAVAFVGLVSGRRRGVPQAVEADVFSALLPLFLQYGGTYLSPGKIEHLMIGAVRKLRVVASMTV